MADASQPRTSTPVIWVLRGGKAGDNTQTTAIADALQSTYGWHYTARDLTFRGTELLSNLLLRVTLAGLDRTARHTLKAPWPDLLISAGRRNEPVARWIARMNNNQTHLVHVGRPWTHPSKFSLVITTPQYFVPAAANVLTLPLPLHGLTTARLQTAASQWHRAFARLPRPWTAVLVGGDSGPYCLTAARTRTLIARAAALREGGSLLVTTSGRTPRAAGDLLRKDLRPDWFFDWHSDPRDQNPYLGMLALCDRFLMTAESASMLSEAHFTGKPVHLFDLHDPPPTLGERIRWKAMTFTLAQHLAPRRLRRDVRRLYAAVASHDDRPTVHGADLSAVTRRIAALLDPGGTSVSTPCAGQR